MKKSRIFFAAVVLSLLFFSQDLFAAEVYYLGQPSSPEAVQLSKDRDLSLKKRFKDLFDFGSFGEYKPDRTGQISGSVLAEVDWNQISGNIGNSFLERGTDYLTESSINAWEQLWRDYKVESRVMIRKTDNPQIETMRSLRLKELNVRLYNPYNMLEFGDLYADFTNFTLGSSLEGFRGDFNPLPNARVEPRIQFIATRKNEEDVWAGQYQRNVFGGKFDLNFLKDAWFFSLVRLGSQCVTSQDDRATAWHVTPSGTKVQDLSNTVFGLDGDVNFKKYFNFRWEWARSAYVEDTSALINQTQYGNALRLEPSFSSRYVNFRYLYYYVQPSFYTEVGSASTDKVQHQFTLDLTPWDKVRLSFVENYYWNHLERSNQPYRTINDEKYITLYLRPWEARRNFDVRTYFNYLDQHSDNFPTETVETNTTTTGFSVNDRIWETSVGGRYEYRAYRNIKDKGNNDYFNRLGANVSRDFKLFTKRLFISGDFTFDFHNPQSEDDNEVTTGVSLNGQYDVWERLAIRGGMNIQDSSAAAPDSGYLNTRSFGELDFLVGKKRGSHLIARIERNVYNNVDGTQDYKELRAITKFVSQF
ncbi:MAG: hypothetical protein A2351_07940 [Omnitrophica bacterium RIFOXYB12_FULL_50_7]|nr:MAG: hypothetical protein A2351_07940 [Omnitrophica bacterium RIFOXYB12_FULL_50_7]